MKFNSNFSISNFAADHDIELLAKTATTERNQPGMPSEGNFYVPNFLKDREGNDVEMWHAMDKLRTFLDNATEEGSEATILQKVCQQLNTDLLNKKRADLAKPPSKKEIAERATKAAQAELEKANKKGQALADLALSIGKANAEGDADLAAKLTAEMVKLAS